jgi:hypothetical protein
VLPEVARSLLGTGNMVVEDLKVGKDSKFILNFHFICFLISFPLLYPVERPSVQILYRNIFAGCLSLKDRTELSGFCLESYTSGYFSILSIYTV